MNARIVAAGLCLLLSAVVLVLLSCAGTLQLHPREGTGGGVGTFEALGKTTEVTLAGKSFRGNYVTNAAIATGSAVVFSGRKSAWGTGTTTYSGNSGFGFLTARDGDTLRCEFQYQGFSAIGVCQDRAGRVFNMTAGQ